jgi:prepilin-type N-terminal cleavage/methylation domain-containing protein
MKKAFTIVELLVAVALLAMLMAISSMVFSAAVKAYRTAGAAAEIAAKLQVMTQQLDDDLRGLRKEGEFIIVWQPSEQVKGDGTILDGDNDNIPDQYISFDRLFFFADTDSSTYHEQILNNPPGGTRRIQSNLARICYSFGRDAADWNTAETNYRSAVEQPLGEKRLFCRTQHLISGDADLPTFPNITTWNLADFENKNFWNMTTSAPGYEYQTMNMEDWWNIPDGSPPIKSQILSLILDIQVNNCGITQGSPVVDLTKAASLYHIFSQGIGQFHVQVWREDLSRWFPEYDPNGDGNYGDSDYPTMTSGGVTVITTSRKAGSAITLSVIANQPGDIQNYWYNNSAAWFQFPWAKALKFTFTLYDSKGVFKDGKTFTHIVYLND